MKLIKYFIQFIIVIILFLIFKLIGYERASNFGSKIGSVFGKFLRSEKIIIKNLDIIIKNSNLKVENKKMLVNDVYSNYGRILSEYMYIDKFRKGSLNNYVNIKGMNHIEEIKSKNKKVVFISGHFNNFELMALFIEASGVNLAAIYRPLNNIFLNKIMENIRIKYICKNQIKKGKAGTRELLHYLKKDFSIALMIDQRVSEGIKCKLFGELASTTTIPAQIVKKYGSEVVPVYIERINNNKFDLTFEKPISFEKKLNIGEITIELNKILEKMILKNPSQWILTHNRWK